MTERFWLGKNVLVTGHTGFKGSWLSLWLQKLGANVTGFSLAPPTSPSLFEQANVSGNMNSVIGDIRDIELLSATFEQAQPEIIFHLAAQSLVRESYQDPIETYSTNVMGSLNVLEAIRKSKNAKAVVMVSTDKCYENQESEQGYKEQDRLGGYDPYSSSKACLEILVNSYRQSFLQGTANNTYVATARAGNVIGGGDYAKDRLIPDVITAINKNENVELRYPHAIRPWQHVLEPLSGYLLLAKKLYIQGDKYAQAWNFGPDKESEKSVSWVSQYILDHMTSQSTIEFTENIQPHETVSLKLNCNKANLELNWQAIWDISTTLDKVISWNQNQTEDKEKLKAFCLQQIEEFQFDKAATR